MPSYIELVNVQIANPVVPPPVPIGNAASGPATLLASVGRPAADPDHDPDSGHARRQRPAAARRRQPRCSRPQPAGPRDRLRARFPPGVLPAERHSPDHRCPRSSRDPTRCSARPASPSSSASTTRATGLGDRIHLGPPTVVPLRRGPVHQHAHVPAGDRPGDPLDLHGLEHRHRLRLRLRASRPGCVNPQMPTSTGSSSGRRPRPRSAGTPLVDRPGSTAGTLAFPPNAQREVGPLLQPASFVNRKITNPAFDAVINAPVTLTANFTAQPAAISPAGLPAGAADPERVADDHGDDAGGTGHPRACR